MHKLTEFNDTTIDKCSSWYKLAKYSANLTAFYFTAYKNRYNGTNF